jgi:hypothetical protein
VTRRTGVVSAIVVRPCQALANAACRGSSATPRPARTSPAATIVSVVRNATSGVKPAAAQTASVIARRPLASGSAIQP